MPRKTGVDKNFRGDDATNAQVLAAIEANTEALNTSVVDGLEEIDLDVRRIARGQELFVWEQEVTRSDAED